MGKKAPWWLTHKPIITVDYANKDAEAGDAKILCRNCKKTPY